MHESVLPMQYSKSKSTNANDDVNTIVTSEAVMGWTENYDKV